MAWVAVDDTGGEWIFRDKPFIVSTGYYLESTRNWYSYSDKVLLPKGTIKKLIGRELSSFDETVEL
jgi:hypothetical protein